MKYTRNFKIFIFIIAAFALFLFNACENYTEDYSPAPASLSPQFSYSPKEYISPSRELTFTNTSIVPVKYGEVNFNWDFGDGTEKSIEDAEVTKETELIHQYYNEVTHAYEDTGKYTVTLEIVTSTDTAEISKDLFVEYALIGDTILYETFDDRNLMPESWLLRNLDDATPAQESDAAFADSAWAVRHSSYFGSKVATGVSYYEPEAAANDWMIMSQISVGDSTAMRWDAMSFTSTGDYPDTYGIYVSTTEQTVDACKENGILMKVEDESWAADIEGGEGIMSRRFYFYEHGIKNQDVYVAFRLMTPFPGGSSLGIDNITVVELAE